VVDFDDRNNRHEIESQLNFSWIRDPESKKVRILLQHAVASERRSAA